MWTGVRVGNAWGGTDLSPPLSLDFPSRNATQLEFRKDLLMALTRGVEDNPCETQVVTPLVTNVYFLG